jgi:hypothetical protein
MEDHMTPDVSKKQILGIRRSDEVANQTDPDQATKKLGLPEPDQGTEGTSIREEIEQQQG